MQELTISSKQQLEKAIERAKAQKPLIREVELGIYKVLSSDATTYYTTAIEPDTQGGYRTCCTCPAQRGFACYHLAAIFSHYLMRVAQAEAVRAQLAAAILAATLTPDVTPVAKCKDCKQAPATSGEGRCELCQLAKDRRDLFG